MNQVDGIITDPHQIQELQKNLIAWFEQEQRDFPWRHTRDPFSILVAEKLLQQTIARPSLVKAYYEILELYPNARALSAANLTKLQEIIRPLGFHYRAHELITLAKALVDLYSGEVPPDLNQLKALPGVGDYAGRAVLSFAFWQDVPIVDTNVARFFFRIFGLTIPFPANPARKKLLINLATQLVPSGLSRNFNLAILDLCALICTPRNPRCPNCPVQPYCEFGKTTIKSELDS
jgi:A/G-specific adenine glycosylase